MRLRTASILLVFAFGVVALGQPQTYAQRVAKVRVGVVLTEGHAGVGPGVLINPAPHAWGNLDRETSVKPREWLLENPAAPTTLTPDTRARWMAIAGAFGGVPAVGSRIDKRHGPYWEVPLDRTGDAALGRFDALLMPVQDAISLSPLQREKLRRFVDQGGVLWIDIVGMAAVADPANPAPIPFGIDPSGPGELLIDPLHPVVSTPNPITIDDLRLIQGFAGMSLRAPDAVGALDPILAWVRVDYAKFRVVAGDASGLGTTLVGQIGDGYVVVTTGGVSLQLSGGPGNTPYRAGDPPTGIQFSAAAKLAVNIVSLAAGYMAPAGGPRRTSARGVDLQPPLFRRFSVSGAPVGQPVIYNNRVIMTSGGRVVVLDANPGDDLDGDGNPDDGLPDALDAGADVIWASSSLSGPSSPTIAEVPGSPVPTQILVTDSSGALHVFPLEASGDSVAPVNTVSIEGSITPQGGPFAPIVHEGIAYMVDSRQAAHNQLGRIWAVDLRRGVRITTERPWSVENAGRFSVPSAGPTIGYIPIMDSSGGLDRVAYVPLRANGSDRPSGLVSIWLGARGEAPVNVTVAGNNLLVTTRAALNNLQIYTPSGVNSTPSLGVKLSVVDPATGRPLARSELATIFTGAVSEGAPGQLNVGLTAAGAGRIWEGPGQNAALRVDYSINWGAPFAVTPSEAYVRGDLLFGDTAAFDRQVLGNLALSAHGHLFAVTGREGVGIGGSLYALREEGRGEFRLLYRWDMHERLQFSVNQAGGSPQTIEYAPAIIDYDGLLGFPGFGAFMDVPMQNLRFTSGPTVSGDTVYVAGTTGKGGFLAPAGQFTTVLMAFDANPPPPEFVIDGVSGNFALVQYDVTRSSNVSQPELLSALQPGQFHLENVQGFANRRKIRIDNMMTVRRGRLRDSLSTNMPIILRQGGQPDLVVEPEALEPDGVMVPGLASGNWSPMRWYTVFNGFIASAQPVISGTMLYLGGGSYLPALLAGEFPPTRTQGLIYGLETQIAPADLRTPNFPRNWMVTQGIAPRPWQPYLSQVEWLAGEVRPSPYFRWPQNTGIVSFADFQLRVRQATLDESTVTGVVAGQGTLAAWGAGRLYGFQRADFLIADEGRIGRFDASGNPIWTTEATLAGGRHAPVGVSGISVPLSTPSRVYSSGDGAFWVVDSGNDRIMRVDAAGRELRTISGFKVDPNFLPSGVPANAPRTLRIPRDVVTYRSIVRGGNNPFTNAQPVELWQHYLIADSGNFRVLELVDRFAYDPNSGANLGVVRYADPAGPGGQERALGVLLWHIRPELAGKQFAYNSIDRAFIPDATGTSRQAIYAFGFGNLEPGRSSFGLDSGPMPDLDKTSGSGGVVLYNPANGQSEVITRFRVPAMPHLWNSASNDWTLARPMTTDQRIAGLTSVTARFTSATSQWPSVMITDVTGVWELEGVGGSWSARWALPNEAYRVMRRFTGGPYAGLPSPRNPAGLRATYAKRLDSDEVIVSNAYFGRTRGGEPFGGEVVLLYGGLGGGGNARGFNWNSPNLGFDNFMLNFELPPVTGVRGLVAPQFASRR